MNYIVFLTNRSFVGLGNLELLNLLSNPLSFCPANLDPQAFTGLHKLRNLLLREITLPDAEPCVYPYQLFERIQHVRYLKLMLTGQAIPGQNDTNKLAVLPVQIRLLRDIQEFYISEGNEYELVTI